jgi:hypothetical protein
MAAIETSFGYIKEIKFSILDEIRESLKICI